MLVTILAFLFILAFSITIHEFGHFLVAKLFKIPVEKFSIGYGPPLVRKKIGETDFRIAYFPLGGYVKIAGEEDTEGTEYTEKEETQNSLNKSTEGTEPETQNSLNKGTEDTERETQNSLNKGTEDTEPETQNSLKGNGDKVLGFYDAPIYQRVLIVLAGPVFNIVSAFFVLIISLAVFGILEAPYLKILVAEQSLAAQAGIQNEDSVLAVGGQEIKDWNEFVSVLEQHEGDTVAVSLMRNGVRYEENLFVDFDSLGIEPLIPPVLGVLKLDGPAYRAGMKQGDRILQISDQKVANWNDMVERVRESGGAPLQFVWIHEGNTIEETVKPELLYDESSKDSIWQIGVIMPLERRHIPITSVVSISAQESVNLVWLTLKTVYQLIIGRISRRALGGPIAIFRLSGESARWGFEYLLRLLAIISINLGLINLFPIPVLDGGHVVISLIEAVRRKRFSRRTRMVIQQVGYAIILLLIVFVTFNDITR